MSSSDTEHKRWTVKFDMSETELMRNVITNLLDILCSSFEYVSQKDLDALRSARENHINQELNMEAFLAEVSVVRDDCMKKMDRMKQTENGLTTAIEDIRKELKHWPVFKEVSLNPVCDEKEKLLSSIANQRRRMHSDDELNDAYTRISSFMEHERQILKKYFSHVKNSAKSKHMDYSTFAANTIVLDSIEADRILHLHYAGQIKHLPDRTGGFHVFEPQECNKYLCPFQHQFHFHECKLPDCRLRHIHPCSNTECALPHFHPAIISGTTILEDVPCEGEQCDNWPPLLKFGDSLYFQQKSNESCG